LKAEIGSPLFERLPAGLRLTAAGEVFARHVLVVLQDAARASSELDALQGLRTGHVEIATVSGVTVDLLPSVLEGMTARYPHITVGVTSLGSQAIPEAVTSAARPISVSPSRCGGLPICSSSASVIFALAPSCLRPIRCQTAAR
jgi:DNA-binding transcriptional LysR family regulator